MLALVTPSAAQSSAQRERGPRAVAVVEVLTGGRARLVPVAIRDNGRFFDANLYRATPRPMAVDPDTLYDVMRNGELAGTFTVESATQNGSQWFGDGRWKPVAADTPAPGEIRLAQPSAKVASDDEDKPPVLRRPGSPQRSDADAKAAPHANAPQQPSAPPAAASADSSDPDRPRLKRDAAPQVAVNERDKPSIKVEETLVAVSDTNPTDFRPWAYPLEKSEATLKTEIRPLALQAIAKFAAGRASVRSAKVTAISNETLRAVDLSLSNEPVLIYTGEAASGNGTFFVTLVLRRPPLGELRLLHTAITHTAYLDSLPRLNFVDAVDAEGTGRGQLLFRQQGDDWHSFVIFRVSTHQLYPLIETTAVRARGK